ncbi:MAG: glycosyltransferase family 4 protein [Thermoanaerobaculia bacterium]|nr:glycosyltransferase family 4 protein [Thermoanaerobaculia bacterium]
MTERPAPALDWVSPLPPVRSGIADYSRDLFPWVEPHCDLRVVRLPGEDPSRELDRRWSPVPLSALEPDRRIPLYHMGNNQHHLEVYRAAREIPGILLLHDYVLHHFHLGRTVGEGDFDAYLERMTADHGWIGRDVARPVRWGGFHEASMFALPVHRQLLRRQRAILVHSRWALERLREEDPDLAVKRVPMGIPLPEITNREDAVAELRNRTGIPREAPLLGSFGFQTKIKRTASAIAALARPELRGVHLLIVGEENPYVELDEAIEGAGVEGRVHRLGYVAFEELQTAMAAVEVCLNLRYPTAGETSASLLRVLAQGRPAVVSDHGPTGDLPNEVAVKVPLGEDEIPRLAKTLGSLLDDPDRLRSLGRAAREYVASRHDPAAAGKALVEACVRGADAEPPGKKAPEVPPPTSFLHRDLPGAIEVPDLGGWRPGERRSVRIGLQNAGPVRWLAAERGPGGIQIQVRILSHGRDLRRDRPWIGLPRDLDPGTRCHLEIPLRRPPGPCRLGIRLIRMGDRSGPALSWHRDLP